MTPPESTPTPPQLLTYLNVVRPDVEGCYQPLQKVSNPSEVGASDAPGAVHQQHDVRRSVAFAVERSPWRHTLIKKELELLVE